jgi:putative membrane protein insertion efficiency factor
MKQLTKILAWPFIFLIRIYQWTLSPLVGRQCRFTPTCSRYGVEALKKYGLFKGSYLTARRLMRCHPWGGHGYDPVP